MLITLEQIQTAKAPTCTNTQAYDLELIRSLGQSYPIEHKDLIDLLLQADPVTRRDREFCWVLYGITGHPLPASYLLKPREALAALAQLDP